MDSYDQASIMPKELVAMNSGIRKIMMKLYEFPIFIKMLDEHNILLYKKFILDAGCGNGNSTAFIAKKFKPIGLDAFDILPDQIERARKQKVNATFFIGDVTHIQKESNMYDAVFIFGILHHVPQWREGIREIYRVLNNGGVFLLEEPTAKLLEHAEQHHHLTHPKEAQFTYDDMKNVLEAVGFRIIEHRIKMIGTLMFILAQK